MAIETSFMKYSHSSSSGVLGQEIKPETMKTWAYSLNACCKMVASLEPRRNKEATDSELHKEESKSCIAHNKNDRDKIYSNIFL